MQRSLLIPLVLSVAVHAAVIGAGEVFQGSGGSGETKPAAIAYDTTAGSAEKDQAGPEHQKTGGIEGGTVSLETSNPLYKPYFGRIRNAVAAAWKPPVRKNGGAEPGRLVVLFSLDRQGALLDITVEQSSGDREKDFAATKAVKAAAPYGAFPPEITDERLAVRARFVAP